MQRNSSSWKSYRSVCDSEDFKKDVATAFGETPYLLQEVYDSGCETFYGASVLLASGNCEQVIRYVDEWGHATYEKIQQQDDGSVSVRYFTDQDCNSPINGPVELTYLINATDTDLDQSILNSSNCDKHV